MDYARSFDKGEFIQHLTTKDFVSKEVQKMREDNFR